MKNYLLFAFCLTLTRLFAQPAQTFLGGNGHDIFQKMVQSPDGHFFVVGSQEGSDEVSRIWLLKIGAGGQVIWEKTYNSNNTGYPEFGINLSIMPDGSMIITGQQISNEIFSYLKAIVLKTDAQGNQIWKRTYEEATALFDAAPSGNNYLLVGWLDHTGSGDGGQLMMVNSAGVLQWKKPVDLLNQTKVRRIFPTTDGNFILAGRTNVIGAGFQGVFVQKIEADGDVLWEEKVDVAWREDYQNPNFDDIFDQSLGAQQLTDGSILLCNPYGYNSDASLIHFSSAGDLLEIKIYGNESINEYPFFMQVLSDGNILMTGVARKNEFPYSYQGFASLIAPGGLEIWRQYYGAGSSDDQLFGGGMLSDGQFLLAGRSNLPAGGGEAAHDGWLIRVESDGNALPWRIQGKIIVDLNNNCQEDPGEPPARDWFIEVFDTLSRTMLTDSEGRFFLRTGDGVSTVTAMAPAAQSTYWTFCQNNVTIQNDAANPVAEITFLVQPSDGGCPHPEVSITQPDLVRCRESRFYVTVQNHGAGPSNGLLLEVQLDPELSMVASNTPYVQNGQTVSFMLDPLSAFSSHTLYLDALLACDVQLGATHALSARISPLECALNWDGPVFRVQGRCEGNTVNFDLQNIGGGNVGTSTHYRIVANDLLFGTPQEVILPPNAAPETISFPGDGHTWRLELQQAPGYPFADLPIAVVEACGAGLNGLHTIGLRNAFRQGDGNPELSTTLSPNTNGLSDKIGEAMHGFGYYNFIGDKDWLEFTARVENPLQEIGEQVEFRLSFSPTLDVRTFQALAWNAQPLVKLLGENEVSILMTNVHLDTSGPGAMAFLRFRIKPLPDVPADSGLSSLLVVGGSAFVNDIGPVLLFDGFHNYSLSFPVSDDYYNNYGPEVLRFGGRSYDFGTELTQAPDGSLFLIGEGASYSDRTNYDGWIIKTDTKGKANWVNAIDLGEKSYNSFRGVTALNDGSTLLTGNALSKVTASGSLSEYTPYLARVDAQGQLVWSQKFRPYGEDKGGWANNLMALPDGNVVVFGYAESEQGNDQFYRKSTPEGITVWQTTESINGSAYRPMEGFVTADGGMVFCGTNSSTVLSYAIFLEKLDANGNKLWSKGYNSTYGIYLQSAVLASDGGVLALGYTQFLDDLSGNYYTTPYFAKFSANGDFEWEKAPIIGQLGIAGAYDAVAAPDGGYYVTGEIIPDTFDYDYDIMLLKTDAQCNPLWWKEFGSRNTEWGSAIVLLPTDGIVIWGHNQPRPPLYDLQGVFVHTDFDGNVSARPEPMFQEKSVVVFPNPARKQAQIVLTDPDARNIRWQLRTITGELVREGESNQPHFTIPVENLSSAIYLIYFPGQPYQTAKLVVGR
ncbi:MAG: hypothetical protein SFV22_07515 [Saprospiraceae bacterium]|nr:hypothetical protein [Saprospiraceae bacterium]